MPRSKPAQRENPQSSQSPKRSGRGAAWWALGFAVIGLAASIASLIDVLGDGATFCAQSGCETVRQSAWAHPLGIPMPVLGVAFYLAAIALAFVPTPRIRRVLAVGGAAWAILLIAVQAFAIGAWCKLCMIADPAAIGYAVAVLAGPAALRFTLPRLAAVVPAVAAAVGGLALWTHSPPPPPPALPAGTPAFVVAAQVPGTITLVEAVDFECPFCRRMQARLEEAIAASQRTVRIVRKMVPLSIHPHAMAAAIAYCCAEAQGKGDEMAAALYAAEPEELTPEGCERIAARIGCDLDRYRSFTAQAQARIATDTAEATAAGVRGLPTLFIGGERVVGASKSAAQLTAMIAAARS